MKSYISLFLLSIENLINLKYHTCYKKHQFLSLFAVNVKVKKKKYLKKKNQFRY